MARLTDNGVWSCIPAVSGQTLAEMQADYTTPIKPPRNTALGTKNVCVLWGGTNDMSSPGGNVSAATALSRFYAYADTLRADGCYTIGITMIPRDDAAAPADFEAKRTTFHADVVANWASHFDAAGAAAPVDAVQRGIRCAQHHLLQRRHRASHR